MARDITINTIYYNLDSDNIEDPLGGIDDLRKGYLSTPLHNRTPLKSDFLRVFRIIEFSSRYHLNVDKKVISYILDNQKIINEFLLDHKNETDDEIKKFLDFEHPLYSFYRLMQLHLFRICIPLKYTGIYLNDQKGYDNRIMNLMIISEFLIDRGIVSKNDDRFDLDFNVYITKSCFYTAFVAGEVVERVMEQYYEGKQMEDNWIAVEDLVLSLARIYCTEEDCSLRVLSAIKMDLMYEIVSKMKIIIEGSAKYR